MENVFISLFLLILQGILVSWREPPTDFFTAVAVNTPL